MVIYKIITQLGDTSIFPHRCHIITSELGEIVWLLMIDWLHSGVHHYFTWLLGLDDTYWTLYLLSCENTPRPPPSTPLYTFHSLPKSLSIRISVTSQSLFLFFSTTIPGNSSFPLISLDSSMVSMTTPPLPPICNALWYIKSKISLFIYIQ